LPGHIFEEMTHFFAVYKALENKETAVSEVVAKDNAVTIIENARLRYKANFT